MDKGYSVYIQLLLDDRISAKLKNILSDFTRINTQAKTLNKWLKDITMDFSRAAQAATRFRESTKGIAGGRISTATQDFIGKTVARRAEIEATRAARQVAPYRGSGGDWHSLHQGYMGIYAGTSLLHGVADMVKPGMEFVNLQNQMIARGEKLRDIQKEQAEFLKATANNLTVSVNEVSKMYVDLRTAFAAPNQALNFLPTALGIRTILSGVAPGQDPEKAILGTLRAAEIFGKSKDPRLMGEFSSNIARVMVATKGRVTGAQYQQLGKVLAGSGTKLSDEFLFGPLAYLLQEASTPGGAMGRAGGPATWLNRFEAQFSTGVMNKSHRRILSEMGLTDTKGGIKAKYATMAMTDPFTFFTDVLKAKIEAYAKRHTKGDIDKAIMDIGATMGAQSLMEQFYQKEQVMRRFRGMIGNKSMDDILKDFYGKDPMLAMQAIQAQWETVKTFMGAGMALAAIGPMMKLAEGLNYLARILQEHPGIGKELSLIGAGLGGVLAISGFWKLGGYFLNIVGPFGKFVALVGILEELMRTMVIPEFMKGFRSKDKTSGRDWLSLLGLGTFATTGVSLSSGGSLKSLGKFERNVVDFFGGSFSAPGGTTKSAPVKIEGDLNIDGKAISKYSIEGLLNGLSSSGWNSGSSFDSNSVLAHPQYSPGK